MCKLINKEWLVIAVFIVCILLKAFPVASKWANESINAALNRISSNYTSKCFQALGRTLHMCKSCIRFCVASEELCEV